MKSTKQHLRSHLSNLVIGLVIVAVFFSAALLIEYREDSPASAPVYSGTNESSVSLMINVYWGTDYVAPMLETLEEYGVKTTFFVGGTWAEKNRAVLERIYAHGHEIGNHGYFHKDHKKIGKEGNRQEISACHAMVKSILSIDMNLFAPPSGSFSSDTLDIARDLGYNTIMWSKDTIDWRDHDVDLIVKRATENVAGGDLILMHPTKETAEALPEILKILRSKNLTVRTVSDVL